MRPAGPRRPPLAGLLLAALVAALPGEGATASVTEQLRALPLDIPRQRLPAPDFELVDLHGQPIRLADYHGRLVLLNFWATFCKPCRDEMPALAALARDFETRGLTVLAVAVDRGNRKAVNTFIHELAIDLKVPLDPDGKVRNDYEIEALPTSYLIGKDGRFIARAVGERRWSGAEFRSLIKLLLTDDTDPNE